MSNILDNIIDCIKLRIQYEFQGTPCLIYVGIGTCAGLKRNENGKEILDDENYHQLPPGLQILLEKYNNLHIFCIYIDPCLENTPFIVTDSNLRNKLNLSKWNTHFNEKNKDFCYDCNKISVYPFRYSIYVNDTKHHQYPRGPEFVNITENLEKIHDICIHENVTYVYHDFSGNDKIKFIEQYFMDKISQNLDHILYGFGNGNITGCYYDYRKSETFFATNLVKKEKRTMISAFNIEKFVIDYIHLENDMLEIYPNFIIYLNNIIEMYNIENLDIIQSIIGAYISNFVTIFKENILYILRLMYEDNKKINMGEYVKIDLNTFGFVNILDKYLYNKINELYINKDKNMFSKIIYEISNKYRIQFELIGYKDDMSAYTLLQNVVSDPDKYKWCSTFNHFL